MPFKDPEAKRAWRKANRDKQKVSRDKHRVSGREAVRNAARKAEREAEMSDYDRALASVMSNHFHRIQSIVAALYPMPSSNTEASRHRQAMRNRAWRDANREKVREIDRRRIRTPGEMAAKRHAYRARLVAAEGTHDQSDITHLEAKQGGTCAYCEETWGHVDHMTPLVRGGGNGPDNLQLLCGHHNTSKGRRTDSEYRTIKGWPPTGHPSRNNVAENG